MIDRSFIDQVIDIGAMRGYKIHEFIIHFETDGGLVLLHTILKDKAKAGKLHENKKKPIFREIFSYFIVKRKASVCFLPEVIAVRSCFTTVIQPVDLSILYSFLSFI